MSCLMEREMCWFTFKSRTIYVSEIEQGIGFESAYGNEQVRNLPLILLPGLAVLESAALNVAPGSVGDHAAEKDGVEPREGAPKRGCEQQSSDSRCVTIFFTYLKPQMRPQLIAKYASQA